MALGSLDRSRLLAVIFTVLLVIWGATCTACSHFAIQADAGVRTPKEQYASAVRIAVTCAFRDPDQIQVEDKAVQAILNKLLTPDIVHVYGGTGVFVSSADVLTNTHVVTCDDEEDGLGIGKVTNITVITDDKKGHHAKIDVLVPEHDLARIVLDTPLVEHVDAPNLGATPQIGDMICIATAIPRFSYKCGPMEPSPVGVILISSVMVEHGNSGSAAYDRSGHIIGLARALVACEFGPCVGVITPITSAMSWLVHPDSE